MDKNKFILITGAAGFIGSYLLGFLNRQGNEKIIIADDFNIEGKKPNYKDKKFACQVERDQLFDWLEKNETSPDPFLIGFVFHLGARTDTTEFDYAIHERLNVAYSKKIWNYCTRNKIPLVYASSAATYGSGEYGYKDEHAFIEKLQPLNPYGVSKNEFDKWALQQQSQPPFWAGLKFFNVFGPNEYHKGRMASMIFHGYNQIMKNGKVRLFKSNKKDFKDGEQLRDFIYVDDVAKVCYWLMQHPVESGIYNLGTGRARSFNDLISAVYSALNMIPAIEYIEMPDDIRNKYQYFTEADMNKLKNAGYSGKFTSLEDGVAAYVTQFLSGKKFY